MDDNSNTKNIQYTPEMMRWWLNVIGPDCSLTANVRESLKDFELAFGVKAKSQHSVYVTLAKNDKIREKMGLKPIGSIEIATDSSHGTKVASLEESSKPRLRDRIYAWFQ